MKICDIRGWGHLTGSGALHLPEAEAIAIQEANGRLIAAAPELLDALTWAQKQLRALVTADDGGQGAFIRGTRTELVGFGAGMDAIRIAIAKAEGR